MGKSLLPLGGFMAPYAKHRAPLGAVYTQRDAVHFCQRVHDGHRMDALQGQVAAEALRAWPQSAQPSRGYAGTANGGPLCTSVRICTWTSRLSGI